MKLSHIAMLTGASWYLMCPSLRDSCRTGSYGLLDCVYNYQSNWDEPLNQWDKLQTFELATDCKANIRDNSSNKTGTCKCIATKDPRLKKTRSRK
jgi:hypothetical protein